MRKSSIAKILVCIFACLQGSIVPIGRSRTFSYKKKDEKKDATNFRVRSSSFRDEGRDGIIVQE